MRSWRSGWPQVLLIPLTFALTAVLATLWLFAFVLIAFAAGIVRSQSARRRLPYGLAITVVLGLVVRNLYLASFAPSALLDHMVHIALTPVGASAVLAVYAVLGVAAFCAVLAGMRFGTLLPTVFPNTRLHRAMSARLHPAEDPGSGEVEDVFSTLEAAIEEHERGKLWAQEPESDPHGSHDGPV